MLLHNETLGRLWGDPRRVADVPWCDVARLGNGLDRIPRLDAVLERLDGCRSGLLLRIEDPADALVAMRTVAASTWDTVVAWTGTPEVLATVRAALPDADTWLPWESLAAPTADDTEGLGSTTLLVDDVFLTLDTVRAAHEAGMAVAVRTVDEPEPVRWAARLGADLIATDDVASARAVLAGGERDGWARPDREPTEEEVATRAQALAHRIAHEVIAFTREHPVGRCRPEVSPPHRSPTSTGRSSASCAPASGRPSRRTASPVRSTGTHPATGTAGTSTRSTARPTW